MHGFLWECTRATDSVVHSRCCSSIFPMGTFREVVGLTVGYTRTSSQSQLDCWVIRDTVLSLKYEHRDFEESYLSWPWDLYTFSTKVHVEVFSAPSSTTAGDFHQLLVSVRHSPHVWRVVHGGRLYPRSSWLRWFTIKVAGGQTLCW